MAVNKNQWTSFADYPLAEFGFQFDKELEIEDHFFFIEEYLGITQEYSICRIDIENNSRPYLNYLEDQWKRFGIFNPSYLPGYKFYSAQFNWPVTALSFYENDQVVLKNISLITNSNFYATYIDVKKKGVFYFFDDESFQNKKINWINYFDLRPPVSVQLLSKIKGKPFRYNDIVGSIRSDIWLDRVNQLKIWNKDGTDYELAGEADNTELAKLNTPRLNSFLRDLKNLGEKYGGKWFFESQIEVIDEHAIPIGGRILYHSDRI